ncbi:hypothetical protein GGX14DRAFT_389329 [Mycena pura]|uniref:Uncharacterized protein n=1 Tax=Mycena pura TaxID=153505 RepID=A0AAD6YKF6_9AGAR|nr:hypothetical protein GGX14DRAFT_389329 [Mycena pura]
MLDIVVFPQKERRVSASSGPTTMDSLPFDAPLKKGLLNVPGPSPASAAVLQELLRKDYEEHHCFWTDSSLLAAHDLGSPESLLRAIFDNEVGMQQPLRKPGTTTMAEALTVSNWTARLGKAEAYPDYLAFFSSEISVLGVPGTVQRYVFAPSANGHGALMLVRVVSGLMHPFIQLGYGIEFGQDFMVAQGLAQAAVTAPGGVPAFDMPAGMPTFENSNMPSPSLLELLQEVYESPLLVPVMPYDPDALMIKRLRDWMSDPKRGAEIRRIYSKWTINLEDGDKEIESKVAECILHATLLFASTGKQRRKPRIDFFLMHYLTGAIFLPSVLKVLDTTLAKAQLLQSYVRVSVLILMLRGRPRINISLVMSYPVFPQPPRVAPTASTSAFGKPDEADGSNPWFAVIKNALHHPEPHVAKAARTLYYAAQCYGHTSAGAFTGTFDASGAETHTGSAGLDGTVFIRAAGVMSKALGWVIAGEEGLDWDRSGLGWEEAWASSD